MEINSFKGVTFKKEIRAVPEEVFTFLAQEKAAGWVPPLIVSGVKWEEIQENYTKALFGSFAPSQ